MDQVKEYFTTCNKVKCLNCLSKFWLTLAMVEYALVNALVYTNPVFNLVNAGATDPNLAGLTADEVYTGFAAIPDERIKRITHWALVFCRLGAIMQSALGFAYGWAMFTLPYKNRYPFHFIYVYVTSMMTHNEFQYGYGMEVGTDTSEIYGYEPQTARLNSIPGILFLLILHLTLGICSLLEKKAESSKETTVEKIAPTEEKAEIVA
jgi:hypothetical protein